MAEEPVQNYANHRMYDPQLVVIAVLLLLGIFASFIPNPPIVARLAVPLVAIAVAILLLRVRRYATRLQDRIIRMEMRERLNRILPAELVSRIDELKLSQLIGLRFASDAELPGLVEKVLSNKAMTSNDIKKLVTQWQADHLRV